MASSIPDSVDADLPLMDFRDVELLAEVGYSISYASKIVIAALTSYGAYFVIASIALYTIAKRSQKTLRTAVLLTALLVTFIITTLQCGLDIALFQLRIQSLLIDNPELPYLLRVQMFGTQSWFIPAISVEDIIATGMDVGILFIINDCLAVWRAVSFYRSGGKRVYVLVLYFFVFTTVAFYVSAMVLQIQETHSDSPTNSYSLAVLLITGSSISITVNAIATSLMAYSAYQYKIFQSSSVVSSGGKIMVLLAESGFIYCLIQIVRMALSISNNSSVPFYSSLDTADTVFSTATRVITAMYTPILIIIIHYGYSMADSTVHHDDTDKAQARAQRRQGWQGNDTDGTVSTMAFGRAERTLDFGSTLRHDDSGRSANGSDSEVFHVTGPREKVKSLGVV